MQRATYRRNTRFARRREASLGVACNFLSRAFFQLTSRPDTGRRLASVSRAVADHFQQGEGQNVQLLTYTCGRKKKRRKRNSPKGVATKIPTHAADRSAPSPCIADVKKKKKKRKYPSRLERKRSMRQTVATHEGHDTAADARARARVSPPNSKFARAVRMYSLSLSRAIIAMSRANLKACR